MYEEDNVCPPQLHQGLFTTAAAENIDHNPSSITAHGSFHGIGISLWIMFGTGQHLRYLLVHTIVNSLNPTITKSLFL